MTPSDLPEFVLVEGLWVDRKIPNVQIARPNFFSRAFRKKIRENVNYYNNELLKLKRLNAHMTAKLHFCLCQSKMEGVTENGKMLVGT